MTTPEDSVIWDTPVPAATRIVTTACVVCGETADLLDPDEDWNLIDSVHESCRDRDMREPDWRHSR